jgi:hypothetical protein
MANFCWYDYFVIYLTADIGAALIIAILSGFPGAITMLPLLVLAWLSYENFRGIIRDIEPD